MRLPRLLAITALLLSGLIIAVCFVFFYGPSPAEKEFKTKAEAIKQHFPASNIVASLAPLYMLAKSGQEDAASKTSVPNPIRSLPIFGAVSNQLSFLVIGDITNKPGIVVWHDGGPVHEGLVYCPFPDGESVARTLHGGNVIIVPWTNGLYLYDLCL